MMGATIGLQAVAFWLPLPLQLGLLLATAAVARGPVRRADLKASRLLLLSVLVELLPFTVMWATKIGAALLSFEVTYSAHFALILAGAPFGIASVVLTLLALRCLVTTAGSASSKSL
ncbi:MAG: hypothetical protein MUC50_00465 [Myxococcota bacterium]|jgi:hypothetical protein|nr:hypothetical protein [Myxococcota bacterium]